MARDVSVLSLMPLSVTHQKWVGAFPGFILPFFPLHSLIFYYFLSCAASSGSFPGIEHSYSISPKFVCTPIPPEADPSCYSPPSVPHGPSGNSHGNGHGSSSGGNWRGAMSDEAKATILHLRESLVRQKETILDQRETIRELTAKLTLCEGFDGHHNVDHHGGHHDDDHRGPHGGHHAPSSHHGPSGYHSSDHHFTHSSHRSDPHHRKTSTHSKHMTFSPEQTGKTLQTLKERLENLQARNSSSSYSSSLRELLQRKISALEEQLHSYHRDHLDYGHHDDHQGEHHDDNHDDDHHDGRHDNRHSTGHRDNHHYNNNRHRSDRYNHHSGHHSRHSDYDHHYDWQHGRHYYYYDNQRGDHHNDHHDNHHDDHHDNHHDDHHDNHHDDHHHEPGHHDDHHDSHHGNVHHPHRLPFSNKETSKLETVLSRLHHGNDHKKPKSPSNFLLDFPMKTNYMYARIKRTVVSELFALTVCLWMKAGAGAGAGLGTPFSYAVPGQANELVLMEWGSNPMELLINDKTVTLPITMTDVKWHHVCVTWSTRDGVWEAFQDGVKKGSGQNLSAWHSVRPGGVFILGQEQDAMGGRFDVTQSFMGQLSDLQFWSRVLTPSEIHSQATCGGHLLGDVISWSEGNVELHGGLSKFPFEPCH